MKLVEVWLANWVEVAQWLVCDSIEGVGARSVCAVNQQRNAHIAGLPTKS